MASLCGRAQHDHRGHHLTAVVGLLVTQTSAVCRVPAAVPANAAAAQGLAKQYRRPDPPVRTSASWLQPADWCEKFQEVAQFSGNGPMRSW